MEVDQPKSTIIFPDPQDKDFDDDVGEEEKKHYIAKFKDLNTVKNERLHCTACDRHLGSAPKSDTRMRMHPMLRTLVCRPCHTFYNSGEFERGDDGSELYCRWCGQGGQVYCCSACPHVFCAKCIKRNMGAPMIREIESLDDWKCFKCVPRGLWDLRATCWAILRYCELKNKMAYTAEDPELRERYQKECAIDDAECCKHKKPRNSTPSSKKKEIKEKEAIKEEKNDEKQKALAKIPAGIKVKKFATINVDTILKAGEKKAVKRPASPMRPKNTAIRTPVPILPFPRPMMQTMANIMGPAPPQSKKTKYTATPILLNSMLEPRKYQPRPQRPRMHMPTILRPVPPPPPPVYHLPPQPIHNAYNGYNHFVNSDNINLSLESLTQGLDMAAMDAISAQSMDSMAAQSSVNDELVCTPDFPMEPLCEVTEDNGDDDVQCITPGPVAQPKPPLAPQRSTRNLPDVNPENIIQMTENDVTVNAVTGGLKFRVDPQTLSANKMYRLPDGRIFAINSNPKMPGGYSATIVAVSDTGTGATLPVQTSNLRGATYAANLSTVVTQSSSAPPMRKTSKKSDKSMATSTPQSKKDQNKSRNMDMRTPIEWYRYNLLDSVDALQYSLSRLERLKKEADTHHLRTRTVEEMQTLHSQLERHLRTSSTRFLEIRDNLNRGFKNYLSEKGKQSSDDDDDDVEILNDTSKGNDDPIFIDENSIDSAGDVSENDVTALSSEPSDSAEKSKTHIDPLADSEKQPSETNFTPSDTKEDEDSEIVGVDKGQENDKTDVEDEHKNNRNDNTKQDADSQEEDDALVSEIMKDKEGTAGNDSGNIKEKGAAESLNSEIVKDKVTADSADSETVKNKVTANRADSEIVRDKKVTDKADSESKDDEDGVIKEDAVNDDESQAKESVIEKEDNSIDNTGNTSTAHSKQNSLEPETTKSEELADETNDKDEVGKVQEDKATKDSEDLDFDDSLLETEVNFEDKNKVDGRNGETAMEVDTRVDSDAPQKSNDNEIQMSDEMIDNLLADDGPPGGLAAELQKFSERSLDSLTETDIMDSEFN